MIGKLCIVTQTTGIKTKKPFAYFQNNNETSFHYSSPAICHAYHPLYRYSHIIDPPHNIGMN